MINIEDLVPETGSFTLKLMDNKEYKLRPVSLVDESWMQRKFGDKIQSIFSELKIEPLCEIAFHQLEDKSDFEKRTVKVMNEDGEYVTETLGGARLLMNLIAGNNEKMAIIYALMNTIGISRPVIEKLTEEEIEKQKKNLKLNQIGPQPSTSSPVNTDGQQNISYQEP